ncbi:solute carrier organic anion transporter family member 4C1 [Drosophila rhopaloa]|uniref:Solute carrier organic anion transporter family member n=1 Tax=Drosophila rhopaloa TaxID=1041015 RepID=A0A6P4FBQ4_DRORH|nr:solute carrier organic anion transporter family member 4C1 [Drosophila rhopaloa]XP_016987869.1 solute carrier organic anion transporter family member 4C1 [Drosophila rhopaloa]XP_016987870.1 solute carrier organic anion transporter family member 4C1 [Drosophila rhopaloa]
MVEVKRRGSNPPPGNYLCGMANWHPAWLQKYATTKMFMAVYGLLGTIQAMSYMYFIVTLTTLEKRFKIPSQTTGIVLSGNEISQIMLSLILSYIGGQRNRPRWIAWGIVFCGLSCYILVLPHFIYGAGHEVLQFTKEYQEGLLNGSSSAGQPLLNISSVQTERLCGVGNTEDNCDDLFSYVPLVLIFTSQFVLGVGNTMYYSLGQTYLDDNTKKTNTPLMLAVAMALRMIGPIVGFFFGYLSLNTFIDPTKTPLIDNKDPRWLGAWWLGWVILGTLMCLFSGLIGLFPKQLPKVNDGPRTNSHLPLALRQTKEELKREENLSLSSRFSSNAALDNIGAAAGANADLPQLKDFPRALMRLLRNKLLLFNITSAVFYILGASGFMTFLTKYMEVQFHKDPQSATIIVGPISILGMVIGLIGSGVVLSKKKPHVSKVLMWNVIVAGVSIMAQISYAFLYCPDTFSMTHVGQLNLTASCNSNCSCEGIKYTPVCHEPTDTTFFSACHAGCRGYNATSKLYEDCSCLANATPSPTAAQRLMSLLQPTPEPELDTTTDFSEYLGGVPLLNDDGDFEEEVLSRSRRATPDSVLRPGICTKNCNWSFWTFSIISMLAGWVGSSGRVGNVLVNYRAVATEDKSFAQGLALMMISLLALIPGPIMFGRLIDSTCLVWTKTCSGNGNCQLYDQTRFRYSLNFLSCTLTLIGLFFDYLVWYYGRTLDIYGDKEAKEEERANRRDQPITPLLAKKSDQVEY